jgi:hypothetical protein
MASLSDDDALSVPPPPIPTRMLVVGAAVAVIVERAATGTIDTLRTVTAGVVEANAAIIRVVNIRMISADDETLEDTNESSADPRTAAVAETGVPVSPVVVQTATRKSLLVNRSLDMAY